jgi:hypothetical protein
MGAAGDGLGGALGVGVGALIQDVVEGVIQHLMSYHHVDHRRGLTSIRQINLVEVIVVVTLDVVNE